jgi:hypothetical protein
MYNNLQLAFFIVAALVLYDILSALYHKICKKKSIPISPEVNKMVGEILRKGKMNSRQCSFGPVHFIRNGTQTITILCPEDIDQNVEYDGKYLYFRHSSTQYRDLVEAAGWSLYDQSAKLIHYFPVEAF